MINGELVVDNFAGGGGASTGIEMATGVSVDIAINHDPEAIRMHRTNHPTTKHYCEDVWQVDPVKACGGHPVGLAWFSPDCFAKGTLVLTETGYQPIETLRVGDKVLTHNGSWKPITATMMSHKKAVRIVGYGNVGMLCSEDHPFLIKNCPHLWDNQVRQYKRVHNDMQWVRAKDIQGDMYWASRISVDPMPIPQLEKPNTKSVFLPVDERLLWLAGRYVGDGWTRLTDTRAEITIASGMQDVEFLREKLNMWSRKGVRCKDGELSWYYRDVRTGGQFTANNRALVKWLRSNFGHLALQKTIPAWLYGAPEPYKEAFMSGYLSADGWTSGNKVECTTISKKLAYGLRTLAVTMGYSPTIYMNHQGDKIEGRTVKTHDIYIVKWKIAIDDKHAQTFTEDGYLWTAVKEVFHWCAEKDKRLIVEDIDLTIKLASRKYGNRKRNHHMTLFSYQRIASSIENQSLRREIAFCKIDPAYTSQMGKFLFMRRYGMSVHQAAAYTIGLVGLGLYDKLVPDLRMLSLLKTKEGIVPELSQETYKSIWARITKAFSGIQKHFFYRRIPYEVLEERTRPSLKTLAAEMKVRYMPKLMNYKNCERV